MSLFKGERIPAVTSVSFSKVVAPTVTNPNGELWSDQTQSSIVGQIQGLNVAPQFLMYQNVTPNSIANTTNATALMTATLPINLANAVGKTISVFAAGTYNTNAAQTPTLTFVVQMGGTNVLSWTSGATTASKTNFPWEVAGEIVVQSNGASANVEAHGSLMVVLGASATAGSTTYLDQNAANVGTINLQANANIALVVAMSSSDLATLINQRQMIVSISN